MALDFIPDLERLAKVFANATAPAFFLGAVAAFVSLMTLRLSSVSDRINAIRSAGNTEIGVSLSSARDQLFVRAKLLSDGIILALISGICATLLLAVLFASQLFALNHAYGSALLFLVATLLLGAALFRFAQEAFHARLELRNARLQPDADRI